MERKIWHLGAVRFLGMVSSQVRHANHGITDYGIIEV